jgi:hypothetical protein
MAYSECLPTRLNPLVAERTCFSQVVVPDGVGLQGGGSSGSDEFKFRPQVKNMPEAGPEIGPTSACYSRCTSVFAQEVDGGGSEGMLRKRSSKSLLSNHSEL